MAISKIVYKSSASATPVTWMDATSATATASDITSPKTAMLADGVMTTGTGSGGSSNITGTFTCPSTGSNYTLNFGATLTGYLFTVEMDDDSKTALMASGQNGARAFYFSGQYPTPSISSYTPTNNIFAYRINPSTNETSVGSTAGFTDGRTASSIKFGIGAFSSGAMNLYYGMTYKYTICPV